jgi:hypothetical protein
MCTTCNGFLKNARQEAKAFMVDATGLSQTNTKIGNKDPWFTVEQSRRGVVWEGSAHCVADAKSSAIGVLIRETLDRRENNQPFA